MSLALIWSWYWHPSNSQSNTFDTEWTCICMQFPKSAHPVIRPFSPFEDTPRIWSSKGLKFFKNAFCFSKWSHFSLFTIDLLFFIISLCLLVPWYHCILFHGVCPLIPTCLGGEALRAAPLEWGTHLNGTQGWASLAQSTVSSPVANCNHWRNTSHNYTFYCFFTNILYGKSSFILYSWSVISFSQAMKNTSQ